jgi:hypothetical protein
MGRLNRRRGALAFAAIVIGGCASVTGSIAEGHAAGTVTRYVFNPSPIGKGLAASTLVNVTVTAESGTTPVPNTTVYLRFAQATGGGTAFVGVTPLRAKAKPFETGSTGQVAITYTTPSTLPTVGSDKISADNAATAAGSTVTASDSYTFSLVGSLSLTPKPIARVGTLLGGQSIPVTVTAFEVNGTRAPSATVYLWIVIAAGGGSASVNGVALTATPAPFKTDSNGDVAIIYKTAASIPSTGKDKIVASNVAGTSSVSTSDGYTYS